MVFSEIRCGIDSFFFYICIHIKVLTLCNFYFWIVALHCATCLQNSIQCALCINVCQEWTRRFGVSESYKIVTGTSNGFRNVVSFYRESGNVVALYHVSVSPPVCFFFKPEASPISIKIQRKYRVL